MVKASFSHHFFAVVCDCVLCKTALSRQHSYPQPPPLLGSRGQNVYPTRSSDAPLLVHIQYSSSSTIGTKRTRTWQDACRPTGINAIRSNLNNLPQHTSRPACRRSQLWRILLRLISRWSSERYSSNLASIEGFFRHFIASSHRVHFKWRWLPLSTHYSWRSPGIRQPRLAHRCKRNLSELDVSGWHFWRLVVLEFSGGE